MSRGKKTVGLSRRDLEWEFMGLTRNVPSDPAALVKLMGEVMMTLIEKNNAAIARSLAEAQDDPSKEGAD